jgi:hypothetical protein
VGLGKFAFSFVPSCSSPSCLMSQVQQPLPLPPCSQSCFSQELCTFNTCVLQRSTVATTFELSPLTFQEPESLSFSVQSGLSFLWPQHSSLRGISYLLVLGVEIELRTSQKLSTCSVAELHHQSFGFQRNLCCFVLAVPFYPQL